MNKQDIIDAVLVISSVYSVPKDQITLGGGAALVLMGIRESTQDINAWVDSPYFEQLAEKFKVTNHPMQDTMVKLEGPYYIRQRNRYFGHDVACDGIQIFDPLTLLILKRGGYAEVKRPLAKRQQDHKDIVILNDILAKKNKVVA
jgi:hypothetical protein